METYQKSTAPRQSLTTADHRVIISRTVSLHPPGSPTRDSLLLSSLRAVAVELESAEEDRARARKRVENAKELFDKTLDLLTGNTDLWHPKGEKLRRRGRKRKGEERDEDADYDERFVPPPEGPLLPPLVAAGGGGLTEEQVLQHRRDFYHKITGVEYERLHAYVPPVALPNLRSRAQLEECVYVAKHWNTGTDQMDIMTFRRTYKNFYQKMKVGAEVVGRRTGHHLRPLAGSVDKMVYCRTAKSGESLMYVAMEDLYDAIFEIHTLKGHRGWKSCKNLANLKYANVPQDHIKAFLDTCPFCVGRKKSKTGETDGEDNDLEQEEEEEEEEEEDLEEEAMDDEQVEIMEEEQEETLEEEQEGAVEEEQEEAVEEEQEEAAEEEQEEAVEDEHEESIKEEAVEVVEEGQEEAVEEEQEEAAEEEQEEAVEDEHEESMKEEAVEVVEEGQEEAVEEDQEEAMEEEQAEAVEEDQEEAGEEEQAEAGEEEQEEEGQEEEEHEDTVEEEQVVTC